jgi:hypothetical protein
MLALGFRVWIRLLTLACLLLSATRWHHRLQA